MATKDRRYGQFLKIKIDSTPRSKVLRSLRSNLGHWDEKKVAGKAKLIVTPNPEIASMAQKDKNLAEIINSSDYSLLDGVGLVQTIKFLDLPRPPNPLIRLPVLIFQGLKIGYSTLFTQKWLFEDLEVVRGRDFFIDLIKLANKKAWRVFLLGGKGVSKDLKEILERSFKKIKIKAKDGPQLTDSGNPVLERDIKLEKDVVRKVNDFAPHLLFVAFGAPKQEKWLNKWMPELKVGAAMAVGGTFDYLTGSVALPPSVMERLGLEWLWRLVSQPNLKRIKRVLTAFPLFPLRAFWHKLN